MISKSEFERVVEEALDSLPQRFADLVDNVAIVIEDEPSEEDAEDLDEDEELLGIYRGVPLTGRSRYDPMLPDEIAIFRGPIGRVSHSREEAIAEVRDTVIHELGHYFGLEDDELP
ncbi:MAG TPA: metallopeptidase family protein [Candidatus Baltobacteraceae bacterium]|jgi:predicted Zn-dependent protease with MMP-like domain|nr:metallopeptidase family protein [Candidatus Baltobacteraceae bacterium]